MHKEDFEKMRNEILKEPDVEYRQRLLQELQKYEEWKLGPTYKADMEAKFSAWEKEAQILMTKEIRDPVILSAISKHHGRQELLGAKNEKNVSHTKDDVPESDGDASEIHKKLKPISVVILSVVVGFFIVIMILGGLTLWST